MTSLWHIDANYSYSRIRGIGWPHTQAHTHKGSNDLSTYAITRTLHWNPWIEIPEGALHEPSHQTLTPASIVLNLRIWVATNLHTLTHAKPLGHGNRGFKLHCTDSTPVLRTGPERCASDTHSLECEGDIDRLQPRSPWHPLNLCWSNRGTQLNVVSRTEKSKSWNYSALGGIAQVLIVSNHEQVNRSSGTPSTRTAPTPHT